ncbi:MAG: DUF4124 domain-containing protein [Gammaproteobacteria bacterium]|nr:DUF4124 domain-containing protein [Gammaproteobacteria bacterium]MDH3858231.1 DUF4124 domain-containing protein [Gammaproteobacteria bacterium]
MLTKDLFCSLLCFGLLSLNGVAHAQVYKSYDADGNVVFSDKPTQGSKEVEVTKPNLSDSFEIPPSSQVESPPESPPEAEPETEAETQPIAEEGSADTNNDGRISRREKEEQRKLRRKKKREMEKAAAGGDEN